MYPAQSQVLWVVSSSGCLIGDDFSGLPPIIPEYMLPAPDPLTYNIKWWNRNNECSTLERKKKCETPKVIGLKHRYLLGDVLTLEFFILAYRTSVKTEIERISIKYPLL